MKQMLLSAALALGLIASGASASTVVFSDDFNTESGVPTSGLANWTIVSGSVDVVGAGTSLNWCGAGNRCLDMNGNEPGRIETTLTGLTVGLTYLLTFDYGNNQNSQNLNPPEQLSFGFVGQTTYALNIFAQPTLTASGIYTLVSNSTTATLFFADTGNSPNDRGGPLLDNVRLSAIPLPAGGLLLLTALGGIAALRRRKAA